MEGKNLLLSFLYANSNESVEGTIKLMKQIFLVQSQKGTSTPYYFEPYDLGPVSFQIYSDLKNLKQQGLIKEDKNKKVSMFSLTPKGVFLAENVFNELDNTTKESILVIKKEFNQKNKDDIVLHVYKKFPQFTFRSKYNAYWRDL